MYPESLLVDDDDGDLSNGTPNLCLINEVFGAHGLYSLGVELSPRSPHPAATDRSSSRSPWRTPTRSAPWTSTGP